MRKLGARETEATSSKTVQLVVGEWAPKVVSSLSIRPHHTVALLAASCCPMLPFLLTVFVHEGLSPKVSAKLCITFL